MSLEVHRCIYKYIYKTCICLCRGIRMLSSFYHSRDAPWMPFLPQQHARGTLSGHCIGTVKDWVLGAVNQELNSSNCEKHPLVVLRLTKYPWKAFQVQSHSTVQWSAATDGIAKMLELYKELWSEEDASEKTETVVFPNSGLHWGRRHTSWLVRESLGLIH